MLSERAERLAMRARRLTVTLSGSGRGIPAVCTICLLALVRASTVCGTSEAVVTSLRRIARAQVELPQPARSLRRFISA